jgi:hypothetical protein
MDRSGATGRHAAIVLELVRTFYRETGRGGTGPEIHASQVETCLDYHEVYRRLNSLERADPPLVRQGPPRACTIKRGRELVTWWPVEVKE